EHVFYDLKKKGVKFFPLVHWVERGMFKRGNSVPRFHMVWGTGYELSERIKANLLNHPNAKTHLDIYFNHKVEQILTEAGRVIGVSGKLEDSVETFEAIADNTIVATGGLGGDI